MLFQMAIFLALVSAGFEGLLAWNWRFFHRTMARFPILNLTFSITLSYFLGQTFGAHGLVALMGGIGSTVLAIPMYQTINWLQSQPEGYLTERKERFIENVHTFLLFCIFLFKVVTFPIWATVRFTLWSIAMSEKISSGINQLTTKEGATS